MLRYHYIMSPCPKIQAFDRGVSPPMVCVSTLLPASTSISKIYMLPTAAAKWRAVRPMVSVRCGLGLKRRAVCTRWIEEMEDASMRRVCPEWVRGVLRRGWTCCRKARAAWGVHWVICMHCSHTCVNWGVLGGVALCWPAFDSTIIIALTCLRRRGLLFRWGWKSAISWQRLIMLPERGYKSAKSSSELCL